MIDFRAFFFLALVGCSSAPVAAPRDAGCLYSECVSSCSSKCPLSCQPNEVDCRGDCQRACPGECAALTGCES